MGYHLSLGQSYNLEYKINISSGQKDFWQHYHFVSIPAILGAKRERRISPRGQSASHIPL